jgi:hypothetical protein
MDEDSSSHFSTVEYGEWEAVGDRITRRRVTDKRIKQQWHWQYRIQRKIDDEIFTGVVDLLPEILDVVPLDVLNQILRDSFVRCFVDAIRQRDGDWVTSK